jgi:type IV secretion system protein VirB2
MLQTADAAEPDASLTRARADVATNQTRSAIMQTIKRILQGPSARTTPLTISAILAGTASPAYAQFDRLNAKLSNVQAALLGIGVIVVTCALLWIAYRMIFQHAKWAEMTQVFWGGAIGGSASVIAAWLFS